SFIAFGQHYAVNVVRRNHLHVSAYVHFAEILRADFGDAQTFGQALRANPRAILRHLRDNALSLPVALVRTSVPDLELSPRASVAACLLVAAAVLAGLVGLGYRLGHGGQDDPGRRGMLLTLGLLAVLLGPVLGGAVLIFPADHYLMPLIVLVLALTAGSLPV